MTDTTQNARTEARPVSVTPEPASPRRDPTDEPIPIWPEGVLALVAGAILMTIGLRHRGYLQRKAREAQRAADEFRRHGGVEDLTQIARQAVDALKEVAR